MRLFNYVFDLIGRFLDWVFYKEIEQENGSILLYARDVHRPVFGIPMPVENRRVNNNDLKYIG